MGFAKIHVLGHVLETCRFLYKYNYDFIRFVWKLQANAEMTEIDGFKYLKSK